METKHQYRTHIENQSWSVFQDHLTKATQEGKAVAADLCATRLDKLATRAANEGLSAAEIVELIREEAAAICSKGGAAWA
jgi:hypothetical protein